MTNVVEMRPKKAYVVERSLYTKAHMYIEGFKPELPKDMWWAGVDSDDMERSDEEAQKLLDQSMLILSPDEYNYGLLADLLVSGSNYFVSPAFRNLCEELEPSVQHYFSVHVVSKEPIGGRTDHGTYHWLRPPPIIDCLLFPQTKTRSDIQGAPWSKDEHGKQWGGGIASKPAFIDGSRIEGRHFWMTRQGASTSMLSNLLTWSTTFLSEYRKRKLTGWEVDRELNTVY